jgi:NH3-dependent NAD+ synthetase
MLSLAYVSQKESFTHVTGFEPRFKQYGGGAAESLALQNIQARLRMVNAYMYGMLSSINCLTFAPLWPVLSHSA